MDASLPPTVERRLHPADGRPVPAPSEVDPAQTLVETDGARSVLAEFAERLAHEIKNPLAAIYGALQVLGHELGTADARHGVVDSVQREVRRLDDTVLELLRFARPETPRPRPTELRRLVEELIEPLRAPLAERGIRIEAQLEDGLVADLDGRLMSRALGSLVANAAQAIEGEGAIEITAARRDGALELEVRDTGPGLSADSGKHLFEPFFTTKSRGLGLGLAIARRIVEAHGGSIGAERAAGGARLRIRLPEYRQAIS